MMFINKRPYLNKEHDADVRFLKDCFDENTKTFYPDVDSEQIYEDFKKPRYRKGKNGWDSILLSEQDGRCCYCMRRIDNIKYNIEHIIPRNIETDDHHSEYRKYASVSTLLMDNVMLAEDFKQLPIHNDRDISNSKKMPHRIALTNFALSCNGIRKNIDNGCCCNGVRGNDFLLPLMLMPDVVKLIRYDDNGLMILYPKEESWSKIVQTLNGDSFKEIRVIWKKLVAVNDNLPKIRNLDLKGRINLFKTAYNTTDFTTIKENIQKYVGLPHYDDNGEHPHEPMFYWHLLLDYDWFGAYYIAHQ